MYWYLARARHACRRALPWDTSHTSHRWPPGRFPSGQTWTGQTSAGLRPSLEWTVGTSVAQSGIFIPDHDFFPSQIPDPPTTKRIENTGYLFCSHKFHKTVNFLLFWTSTEKDLCYAIKIFSTKNSFKSSELRDSEITISDPGPRGQKSTSSWSLDPQHLSEEKRMQIGP